MVDTDPAWYSAILSKHDRDRSIVKVLSVVTEPGSKVGDNYASIVERATLKVVLGSGKVTTKRVILKKGLTDVPKEISADMSGAFNMESLVYDKILVQYGKIINENCVLYDKFWADCFYTSHNLMIFEDLKVSGFTLGSRHKGLDPIHAELVVTNLARLHSLSVVGVAEGTVFAKMLPAYMITNDNFSQKFFRASMKPLADIMRDQWGPEWSKAEQKVRTACEDIVPTLLKLYNEPHKLSVVNHGDCWVNNMMFKYDSSDTPVELKFVDFQISHYNTYAWDLVYFFHTSIRPNYLSSCRDQLIEIYSKEFRDNLEKIGYDVSVAPTVQEIKDEITRLGPFALAVTSSVLPITANPSDIKISLDDMVNEENTKFKELFEDKNFIETIQGMFQYLSVTGVI